MGTRKSFICPICEYQVFMSGGRDRGFRTYTNTHVCTGCHSLHDLAIDVIGHGDNRVDKIANDQLCLDCGSKQFEVWDSFKMPCPKCGSKLQEDEDGMIMRWD